MSDSCSAQNSYAVADLASLLASAVSPGVLSTNATVTLSCVATFTFPPGSSATITISFMASAGVATVVLSSGTPPVMSVVATLTSATNQAFRITDPAAALSLTMHVSTTVMLSATINGACSRMNSF